MKQNIIPQRLFTASCFALITTAMTFAIRVKLEMVFNQDYLLTLEEIGAKFDLTRERVRQIKEKAIRRLRHTSRSKLLKAYLG